MPITDNGQGYSAVTPYKQVPLLELKAPEPVKQGNETFTDEKGRVLHIVHSGNKQSKFNETNESIDWAWWSWNPITGCNHGCPYCLHPDTLILMANGTSQKLIDVEIGDEIIGVVKKEKYHYFQKTKVLNKWWTHKKAYEITMANGETLIASGDHRFLTTRGWKYVTGTMSGDNQRPFLTTQNKILGIGNLTEKVQQDANFKVGYLSGIIYGDASVGEFDYKNSKKPRENGKIYSFRLALKDEEALTRTYAYLLDMGIECSVFDFSDGNGSILKALRTNKKENVEFLQQLKYLWSQQQISLSDTLKEVEKTYSFWVGFISGLFDAEGSYSQSLRISNTNLELLEKVQSVSSEFFCIDWKIENSGKGTNKPVYSLWLKGGLSSAVKFFNLFNPAISRKFAIDGLAIKGQGTSQVVSIKELDYMDLIDITTGTETFIANGFVSHNCYARDIATSSKMSAIYPFGFEPTFLPHRLIAPKNTKPFSPDMIRAKANQRNLPLEYANQFAKNVFVCSMADLFGDWTPTDWIKQVFEQVTTYTQWNYLFLTKFPQRLKSIQDELLGGKFPDNCWVGTTVDEQKRVKIAQKAFEGINAKVKWLSLEPLLTNLEFDNLGMFDMVAIGGQSGNSQCEAQQPEWEWVENIICQAHQSKTMVYFKENLTVRPKKLPIN